MRGGRRDIIDDDDAFQPPARLRHESIGAQELLPRRHQRLTVPVCPAVELHGGDLDAARAEFHGEIEHLAHLVHVLLVADGIDGQRNTGGMGPFGHRDLAVIAALVATHPIGKLRRGALNGKLKMVEARFGKLGNALFGEPDAGGDEIGIEPRLGGRRRQFHKIAAGGRLTAGEMQVQDAERCGLPEHRDPLRSRELRLHALKLERIGAIGTGERTAMRQLCQHGDRRGDADAADNAVLICPFACRPLPCWFSACALDAHMLVHGFNSSIRRLENSSTKPITSART